MTTASTLKLFHDSPYCRSCGHTWQGYVHGFSRGHSVLIRGARIAFIPDDLGYAFLDVIDAAARQRPIRRLGDFADPLRRLGWRDLNSCPVCGSRDIIASYDHTRTVDVPCVFFGAVDFRATDHGWDLTITEDEKGTKGLTKGSSGFATRYAFRKRAEPKR